MIKVLYDVLILSLLASFVSPFLNIFNPYPTYYNPQSYNPFNYLKPLTPSKSILNVKPSKTVIQAKPTSKVVKTKPLTKTTTTNTALKATNTITSSIATNTIKTKTMTNTNKSTELDYKTQMAMMISQLTFADTPQGKNLKNKLTNQLFAIYNTLNKIGNSSINQILYKDSLKKQVDQFMKTLDQIQKIAASSTIESDSSFLLGSDNILIGDKSIVDGDDNKVKGNQTLVSGTSNMVSGNESITNGASNVVIGNNTFVVGNNNKASGNNTYVFSTNSNVAKNNSLVVANFTIDLNQLKSSSNNFLSSSNGKK